jgi:hypothetical protein
MLAAFGVGQSAPVFATSPFRRYGEQLWIAGRGGTALAWSSAHDEVVFFADDYPRLKIRALGREDSELEVMPLGPRSTCVAITGTPDGRRVVTLEEEGRIRFIESEHLVAVFESRSGLKKACDLAVDPNGNRLAIAGSDGAIEIWDAGPKSSGDAPDVPQVDATWSSTLLVEPTAKIVRVDERMVRLDSAGRVSFLCTISVPSDFREEGPLYFLHEGHDSQWAERLEAVGGAEDRRASFRSTALRLGPRGEPITVFRLRTALTSPYDGTLYLGRRTGQDAWEFQTVHPNGNWGFHPIVRLDHAREPCEIVHFSFGGSYTVRSTATEGDGEPWNSAPIGPQGFGLRLHGRWDTNDNLHAVCDMHRYAGDTGPRTYGLWDGTQFRRENIDPFAQISLLHLELAPDGNPVVLLGTQLVKRSDGQWTEYEKLPAQPDQCFALARDGTIYFAKWDGEERRLLFYQGRAGDWSVNPIAWTTGEAAPNWWTIRLDNQDRPVIVAGRLHEPYGWIRVLRRGAG